MEQRSRPFEPLNWQRSQTAAAASDAKRDRKKPSCGFLHVHALAPSQEESLVAETIDQAIVQRVARRGLSGARDDRLFFAQVREDPLLEIEALSPLAGKKIAVISSGGCTALSLIAAGAGRVTAIDLNRSQNHLVELKCAAVMTLAAADATAFLGGASAEKTWRREIYAALRPSLSTNARSYWDGHPRAIRCGVIGFGVSERLLKVICGAVATLVHSRKRCAQLLNLKSLQEQAPFYRDVWNTWRWRLLFPVLCNRFVFNRAYDPGFFRYLREASFSGHFRNSAEHGLTAVPVRDNYFLHQMLTGFYLASVENGLPPYLAPEAGARMRTAASGLELVDGSFTDYLKSCADSSVDGFSLSNICEWLTLQQIDALFSEILRTAAPGARLCFRNFVGWTEVPKRFRHMIVEDRELGNRLSERDRALMQLRFAICNIDKSPNARDRKGLPPQVRTRAATEADKAALLALGPVCPMEGDVGLYMDRSPDVFALGRIEGPCSQVGVAETAEHQIVGCVSASVRHAYVHGSACRIAYVGDLKVAPAHRNLYSADALSTHARNFCARQGGADVPVLITVLDGNKAMEYRARGFRGMPHFQRFATIRSYAIPLLWHRARALPQGLRIARATSGDLEEMVELWRRVAPRRQFAPVFSVDSFAQWIAQAPALELEDYRLARDREGRLRGFFALWDQSAFKAARVTQYSPRLAAIRSAFNIAAPVFGAPHLPRPGERLCYLTVTHLCVPPEAPDVLRALLRTAYNESRRGEHSFIEIGLDVRDPLAAALHGLMAVPTDIGAYISTPAGVYRGPALDDRPLHFEIALA